VSPVPTLPQIVETLAEHGLELVRSWPRSAEHLLLDLRLMNGANGSSTAGQWFSSSDQARMVAEATNGSTCIGQFVFQPGGADRALRPLRAMVAEPTTELISHRAERRAVLRERSTSGVRFTKVVPRKKLPGLHRATARAAAFPLRTPAVEQVDPQRGTVTTAALPGVPLHELLRSTRAEAACMATGAALAAVHRIPVPADLPEHSLADEQEVARTWQAWAAAFGAPLAFHPSETANAVQDAEPADRRAVAVVHRDFHDKQVLVADDDTVGILDFDLAAVGDPALDLANLLVHLQLRQRQGMLTDSSPLEHAVLLGYQPSAELLSRLPRYMSLTWTRLAAVYAFRPGAEPT
jgi:aminoglycoside phosphotransferase